MRTQNDFHDDTAKKESIKIKVQSSSPNITTSPSKRLGQTGDKVKYYDWLEEVIDEALLRLLFYDITRAKI